MHAQLCTAACLQIEMWSSCLLSKFLCIMVSMVRIRVGNRVRVRIRKVSISADVWLVPLLQTRQQCGNWTFRSQDHSLPGAKVPDVELSLPETFAPWNFHSVELSHPGTFFP